jgi:succinate dehydrogenase hydrophobic anchor subunit
LTYHAGEGILNNPTKVNAEIPPSLKLRWTKGKGTSGLFRTSAGSKNDGVGFLSKAGELKMTSEKKRKTAKILSAAVGVAGIAVMLGWIFNIGVLKSISPAWISMKFSAAIVFVLSGITLYFIVRAVEGELDKAQVVLSITSLIIVLLMGILFFSAILGIQTGTEDLFVKEKVVAPKTIVPGRPSIPTMVDFILVAVAGVFTMFNSAKLQSQLKIIGLIVGAIGVIALVGYIFDAPILYYYVEGVNSAMACHTAVLFVLLGVGLLCL